MKIFELFDNPAQWKYDITDKSLTTARFDIEDKPYKVTFHLMYVGQSPYNMYALGFDLSGRSDISGTGDQYTVFATVKDILKDFLSKNDVDCFYFFAEESSRASLYKKFIPFLKRYGYTAKVVTVDVTVFILGKDDEVVRAAEALLLR